MNEYFSAIWTNPVIPVYIMAPLLGVIFLLVILMMIWRRQQLKTLLFTGLRVFLIFALAFIINLRPMHAGNEANLETRNVDVLFVVDTTISMWALDYNGEEQRINGVLQDCQYIMEKLAGANFGLIRFDNRGQILAPFTQDVRNVSDAMDTIRRPDNDYASGTDLSAAYPQMLDLLESSYTKEDRKTVVFFFSDGEITNGAARLDYSPLAYLIDAGAVLGYGTAEGGKMETGEAAISHNRRRDEGSFSYGYFTDPQTGEIALSKIDENNLKGLAEEMGLEYIYMDKSENVDAILSYIRQIAKATVGEAKIQTFEDTYFYYAIPLLLLLLLELVRMVYVRKL